MNILTSFAQSYYTYSDNNVNNLNSGDVAGLLIFYFIFLLFGLGIYVVVSLCLMRIFKKAGVKQWIAWVPFYNNWKMLEIGGQQGFWAVLAVVPIVSIVSAIFMYIAMYHIGRKLGKGDAFVVLGIFLPLVWFIWLAVDGSTWNEAETPAPAVAA